MTHRGLSYGFSLLVHGTVLWSVLSMGGLLPKIDTPLVIDFSITERCAVKAPPSAQPPRATRARPLTADATITAMPSPVKPMNKITEPLPELPSAPPLIPQEVVAMALPRPVIHPIPPQPIRQEEPLPNQEPQRAQTVTAETDELVAAESSAIIADNTLAANGIIRTGEPTAEASAVYLKSQFVHITTLIQSSIHYPQIARKMGWEGKVIVRFVISEQGEIITMTLVESSGFPVLDNNALATIKKAAPFPCPPIRAELIVPVTYRLG
ncbi:MAG: energy transducer TonB [Proteobacteria bacterium]|nr:energy transducer TonB [Pseudomonadota bacterium]MBU1687441.1 energy transducer TonB [Pseudomonadota bacterium]